MSVTATLPDLVAIVRAEGTLGKGALLISARIEAADSAALEEHEGARSLRYSYLVRLSVSAPGLSLERTAGSDAELTEGNFVNDLPHVLPVLVRPRESEGSPTRLMDVRVDLVLTFLTDAEDEVARHELGGEATLTPRVLPFEVRVVLTPHTRELPLSAPLTAVLPHPIRVAPPLPVESGAVPLAVLPDEGMLVLRSSQVELVTPEGATVLSALPPLSKTPSYDRVVTAGPAGRLAVTWGREGLTLSVLTPPSLSTRRDFPRALDQTNPPHEGAFDPTGRFFVFPIDLDTLGVIDVSSGAVLWRRKLHAWIDRLALCVTDASVWVAGSGELRELSLATGVPRRHRALPWVPPSVAVSYHPAPDRFAWAETLSLTRVPLGVVFWQDGDGAFGHLVLGDALTDSRVVVLDDGCLLVQGDALWHVDPARGAVDRLGERVQLPHRPLVTRTSTGHRLWTLEPEGWFIEVSRRER